MRTSITRFTSIAWAVYDIIIAIGLFLFPILIAYYFTTVNLRTTMMVVLIGFLVAFLFGMCWYIAFLAIKHMVRELKCFYNNGTWYFNDKLNEFVNRRGWCYIRSDGQWYYVGTLDQEFMTSDHYDSSIDYRLGIMAQKYRAKYGSFSRA